MSWAIYVGVCCVWLWAAVASDRKRKSASTPDLSAWTKVLGKKLVAIMVLWSSGVEAPVCTSTFPDKCFAYVRTGDEEC